jgi:hypothetical protein
LSIHITTQLSNIVKYQSKKKRKEKKRKEKKDPWMATYVLGGGGSMVSKIAQLSKNLATIKKYRK